MKKISVNGVIIPNDYQRVYDWIGWEATSPKVIQAALDEAKGGDVEININSPGGDVDSGSVIYNTLMAYSGNLRMNIVGIAASAGTIIAMAGAKNGSTVAMGPTSRFMIHKVASSSSGNHKEFEHRAEAMKKSDSNLANAYVKKTGLEKSEILAMMDYETWFTAEEALEKCFIDEIMFEEKNDHQLVANSGNDLLPKDAIMKLTNLINMSNPPIQAEFVADSGDILLAKSQLELLKLKK